MNGRYFLALAAVGMICWGCTSREGEVIKRAEALMAANNYNQALDTLQAALRENPDNAKLLRERVRLFLKSGQADYAIVTFRKLAEKHSGEKILVDALKDPDVMIRVTAVKTLGLLRDASAAKALISVANDPERNVRQAVIVALGDLKSDAAMPVLIGYLKDKDWFIRAEAAQALGKVGDARAADELFHLLDDTDRYVKQNARQALQNLATQENKPVYLKALASGDTSIRIMAALALAKAGDRSGVNVILNEFDNAKPEDQVEMIKALAQFKEPSAVPKARAGMTSKNVAVRVHSILTLGILKDAASVGALKKMAQDKNEPGEVRLASLRALELIDRKP